MLRRTSGVLLLAVTLSQALVALHGYAHTHAPTFTECSICRLSAEPARVAEVLDDAVGPYAVHVDRGTPPSPPYVRPVHSKRIARAPPLSRSTSEPS